MNKYIKTPSIININGYCGSGKSYFCKYLCLSMRENFNNVVVFSNTANFSGDYDFLKSGFNYRIYSTANVNEMIKMILNLQKKNRAENNKINILMIFDDIFSSVKDSKDFKNLVSTYRHYNISIIFSTQYVCGSASYLREISQYVIIFNQRTGPALKACYDNYFIQDYEKFSTFKLDFTNKLQNYQFYFIDRIKNTKHVMKCPKGL